MFKLDLSEIQYQRLLDTKLKVRNNDGGIEYEFASESIKITISQDYYSTFEKSMMPVLSKLVVYYSQWFDTCDRIELKYVDLWSVPNISLTIDQLKSLKNALFTSELRDRSQREDDNIDYWEFNWDDCYLKIKFGYGSGGDTQSRQGIALESRCGIHGDIPSKSIIERTRQLNSTLYDAFIWSVSAEVINAMRNQH
ncbi:MAG: hypothetical protein NC082_08900 [Clostridiales bacterium]|nr:hypothetical protein [Clostridiales bacterium]